MTIYEIASRSYLINHIKANAVLQFLLFEFAGAKPDAWTSAMPNGRF